jgi:hypothetical protein
VRDRFRRLVEIYLAVYIALFLARVVFDWAFDVDGTPLLVVTIVLGVVGLAIGIQQARDLPPAPPLEPDEQRDTVLGWGGLIGAAVSLIVLFALPMPWGAIAAAAAAGIAVITVKYTADAVGPD